MSVGIGRGLLRMISQDSDDRPCALNDLDVVRDRALDAWRWSCSNDGCPHHGWQYADTENRGYPSIVDAARAHVLGHRPCRPLVHRVHGTAWYGLPAWSWTCLTHGPALTAEYLALEPGSRELFPGRESAYADAVRHVITKIETWKAATA